jgi:hypothetical protein
MPLSPQGYPMMPPADTPTHLSIKMWMKNGLPSDSVASQSTDGGGWLPLGEFACSWGLQEVAA